MDATKLVTGEILGYNGKTVMINSKIYTIQPPTIKQLSGAAFYLTECENAETLSDSIRILSKANELCRALSWFIAGDESLAEELADGSLDEVVDALCTGFELISLGNFLKLSSLARSAASLIANRKQSATTA